MPWTEELTAAGAPRPAAAPAPVQLPLFEHQDAPPARVPRLRRLKTLLQALESHRTGLKSIAALDLRRKPADPPSPSVPPSQAWLDSFFD